MDVATALTRIKRQFGDEYDVIIMDDDIYGWIYEAEMDIIRTVGANEQTMEQGTTVFPLNVPENINITRLSIDGRVLKYTSINEMASQNLNINATGARTAWYKKNSTLYLYPADSLLQTVTIEYTKIPTIMQGPPETNLFTVPEKYRTDVIQYCLAKAHNKNRNYQAERVHMENYQSSLGLRKEENVSIDGPVYKGFDPLDIELEEFYW